MSEESLTSIFRQAVKKHFYTLRELLSDQDVFPGQPSLLFTLSERDGQSQKELAAHLHNKAATMTVMLNRMEKNGLVQRQSDLKDQRITRIFLTEKGRKAHDQVKKAMNTMETICFSNFSVEEKQLFQALILKMVDNLEQYSTTIDS